MADFTISSGHFSVDGQAMDALRYLQANAPEAYAEVLKSFPEIDRISFENMGSHFDTDTMGVDVEWGSWLVDAIEATDAVYWEDGEPWAVDMGPQTLFVVTHNIAGYMPEADPVGFESFADAKGYVIDELKREADSAADMTTPDDETYVDDLERCAAELASESDENTIGWSDYVDAGRFIQGWQIERVTVDRDTALTLLGD